MDNPHDAPSPSKGKATDAGHKTWRASWWDFYPMLERPGRPIQWSQSSVIFTAHPSQPMITGRHFSSSKQFILPSPTSVLSSPISYEPPSVISVSPSDEWLFAYFPRRDGEGIGCLWKRGAQIDSWQVNEYWSFAKGGGVVTASWLTTPREWASNSTGNPTRLPTRGPAVPVSSPTLFLITQDHYMHIKYHRYVVPGLRTLKRSLSVSGMTFETAQNAADPLENVNGTRQCIDAAVGLGYNDSTIFIATRSRRVPAPPITTVTNIPATPFNSMDLSVPVDLSHAMTTEQRTLDWETWGEERSVDIYEAHLKFDGMNMALAVRDISTLDIGTAALSSFTFLCAPPSPTTTPPPNEAPSKARSSVEKGTIHFAMVFANLHEYTSPSTSSVALYSFTQKIMPGSRAALWSVNRETLRTLDSGLIAHLEAFVDFSVPSNALIHAYVLDNSGPVAPVNSRTKEVPIGSLQVWNIPDLSNNSNFEFVPVKCHSDSVGRDLPLFAAVSPNGRLICTLSSSLWRSQTTIHSLPKANKTDSSAPPASSALATGIFGRKSTEDIVHCLASPKISLSEARDVMYHALHILELSKSDLPYASTWDIMGIAIEVYKSRLKFSKDEQDTEMLKDRWHTAHDVCSLAACNIAFEDCKEEDAYDLEAAWPIIGMCTWVVDFTEKLMKACVLSGTSSTANLVKQDDSSLGTGSTMLDTPILLHLAHPFTLQNLVAALKHTKAIRGYIGSLPAGGENPQMAQRVLVDTVDCSGIDFGALISLLEESLTPVQALDSNECQKALVACQPLPVMRPLLTTLVHKISDSETILNKATLFIKPHDLADGIAGLSLGARKNNENDVISKGLLLSPASRDQCLRCGGRTSGSKNVQRVQGLDAPKWLMWERMWQVRCICGGPWLSALVH